MIVMAKNVPITDQLRQAIAESGVSRYRIAKDTGVSQSTLAQFVNGKRGLSMEALDAIGQYLGLTLVSVPKPRKTKD
jgi:transcriptional regulator with XRE-family HTH domain